MICPTERQSLWLEDIAHTIGGRQKAHAQRLLALLAPIRMIERACGQRVPLTIDDLATIIFSSGSTGEPKGVMLSHFSIDANVQGATASSPSRCGRNRVFGILPFFHSFGYLVFWFVDAQRRGDRLSSRPRSMSQRSANSAADTRLTFLVTTPTFLQLYSTSVHARSNSASLRVVLTGAENCRLRLCQAFEDRFGIDPIEGYGVTECAPVIAVNCPDFRATGILSTGLAARNGRTAAARRLRPHRRSGQFRAACLRNTPGMLLVKGPNIMSGYLGREDLTAQRHPGRLVYHRRHRHAR